MAKLNTAQSMLKSSVTYQPSLPLLLTEYGFQEKASEKSKDLIAIAERETNKEQRKLARKQRKKMDSFDDTEDERALERQRERDEHYEALVENMHRLRDYYYHEYTTLLANKVQRQRREIRERDERKRKEEENLKEEQRMAGHRVKKRLERHTLDTTPGTVDVPKTDLYHIVGLEDKLRREGKLKTNSDYDKFWQEIEQPHVFYSQFKVHKNTDFYQNPNWHVDQMSSQSLGESRDSVMPLTMGQHDQEAQPQLRSLSRISEGQETSRPGTRMDSWAVTQQYPAQYKARRSLAAVHGGKTKGDNLSEIEKRFPKLEMPKLHCFTMNLAQKPPDPDQVLMEEAVRSRQKNRQKMSRTVGKMYQLAMSNSAVSSRILNQHEDINMLFEGPDLCDVIADHHWAQAYGLRPVEEESQGQVIESQEDDRVSQGQEGERISQTDGQRELTSAQGSEKSTDINKVSSAQSDTCFGKSSRRDTEVEQMTSQPLTLDEVTENCNIMEAKTLSTLWTNYLRAGK